VVIVSHDRFLLDKLCDHLFVFEGDGKIKDYNGRYMDYRAEQMELAQELRQQQSNAPTNKTEQAPQVRTGAGLTNKEKRRAEKTGAGNRGIGSAQGAIAREVHAVEPQPCRY
jgi:ATP-binding cassette subfamily F protein uup